MQYKIFKIAEPKEHLVRDGYDTTTITDYTIREACWKYFDTPEEAEKEILEDGFNSYNAGYDEYFVVLPVIVETS